MSCSEERFKKVKKDFIEIQKDFELVQGQTDRLTDRKKDISTTIATSLQQKNGVFPTQMKIPLKLNFLK